MNLRSVADLDRAIVQNLWKLNRGKFDVIVGIPRSGMIPASIIATYLQMPLATIEGYVAGIVHGRSGRTVHRGERILLVDDTSNKGGAMARAVAMLPKGVQVTRCAVFGPYQVADPSEIIDVVFEDCKGPRAFTWNAMKHARLWRWGFDFDGVFCRDPSKAENDDGPEYARFLETAEPLFLPLRPVGHIITGRLEKYRDQTEAWMKRHGIECEQLHMTPFASKAERMDAMKAAGGRGQWKGMIAHRVGIELFVESCPKQAAIIRRVAGVPVWCTGTGACA